MRTRTLLIAIVVVVAVGGVATAAIALTSSVAHAYRTATATTGSVTRELQGTGTIQPVSQATVAFPISGTVNAVDVALGSSVATGATLATLETSSLESAVLSKQAALASAQLNLYKALHGEAVGGGGGSGATGGNGRTSTSPTTNAVTTAAFTSNTTDAALAVVTAQHAVDVAMAAVDDALAAAGTACGQTGPQPHSGGPGGGGRRGPAPSTPTTTTSPTTTAPATTTPSTGIGSAACQSAEQSLYGAQEDLAQKQQALGRAENAYEQALRSSSGGTGRSGGTGNANLGAGGGNGGNGSNNSSSVSYSAEDFVSYQAAVDAATAAVAAAEESVAQATIKSPISGTVVALSLVAGQQVTAGSSTANVVIAGGNGYEIATSIDVNDVTQVKVGDAASVVPDGSLERVSGQVVFVGSPTTSGSSTTYPVVIGLTQAPATLRNGAMGTTVIDTATSSTTAVLVPTSAVHDLNGRRSVTVLQNGKATTVAVNIGVVGAQLTEITSGIDVGQTVVLADVDAAVPSSSADSRIASQFGSSLTGGANRSSFGGG